jgi:quinoprotein glucose dehydrogenase
MGVATVNQSLRVYPILLVLLALPLVIDGGELLFSYGGSFYYFFCGIVLCCIAVLLWRGRTMGSSIFGMLLLFTLAWALFESGLDHWALAPRILPLALIGSWLLMPWTRRRLYGQDIRPLFKPMRNKVIGVGTLDY